MEDNNLQKNSVQNDGEQGNDVQNDKGRGDGSVVGAQQKVVSLKGVHTEGEIEEQKRINKVKEGAVILDKQKTKAELKKEKELEKLKQKAVVLEPLNSGVNIGGQKNQGDLKVKKETNKQINQENGKNINKLGDKNIDDGGNNINEQADKKNNISEARTVIMPNGRIVEVVEGGEKNNKNKVGVVNLKEKKIQSKMEDSSGLVDLDKAGVVNLKTKLKQEQQKNAEGVVNLGNQEVVNGEDIFGSVNNNIKTSESAKKISIEEEMNNWRKQKIDLSALSSEQRLDLQATPSLASVHLKMDEDTNGELTNWFDEYNKLPVNIKLGLGDTQTVQQVIKDLAQKFQVMTEEGLGEISRIVRDVYVNLIGESEIKKRVRENLKIKEDKINEFVKEIASIVALVRTVGNKKTDEYFEKLSVKEILDSHSEIAEKDVTKARLFDKQKQEYVKPTLKNWVDDYINFAGSGQHSSLERTKYLEESVNTKNLDEDDRMAVDLLTRSYDKNTKLVVDPQDKVVYWRLHTDESELGINSDENKRVINHFKIDEAQKVDVDDENQINNLSLGKREQKIVKNNKVPLNNLGNLENRGIMEDKDVIDKNQAGDDVLDLSSELKAKND